MDRYILEMPNIIPPELCKRLIDKFEKDPRKKKGVIGGIDNMRHIDESLKKSVEIHFTSVGGWEKEDAELSKYVSIAIKKYLDALKNNFRDKGNEDIFGDIWGVNLVDTGFDLQRIDRGSKYAWHHDGYIDDRGRIANILMYLNTLEPHEGGTTELISGRKIRPEVGKIVMFPASWTFAHCGNEVKAPHKYICCSLLRTAASA